MSRKIKVVRLLPVLNFGGVESRVSLQAKLMDRDKFELRVCTFWGAGEAARRIEEQGIGVDVLGVDPRVRNPVATLRLWRYLIEQRPDVLHASIAEAMFHGALAGWLAAVPRVIIEETGQPGRGALGNLAYGWIGSLVDKVVGVSQATCDYLIERDRMPADRVQLIYNCGHPRFFERPPKPSKREGALRVFTAGRLVAVKNQQMLLEVMARLIHDEGLAVHLSIAGDGPLRSALEARRDELKLGGHVSFLGFREDVEALLERCDVFVVPSHSEGCSIALLEAMAMGVVPLGSTASGVREVMGELGEELMAASDDHERWAELLRRASQWGDQDLCRLGERAREIAHRRFSPRRYIDDLELLYR
jgi:glycosyltransferase involved in cell wall biosynthesis